MAQVKLEAKIRKETGKGAAKALRREGRVPAVLYGRHMDQPIVMDVDAKATEQILRTVGKTAIISLEFEGADKQLAMLADYQRDVFGTRLQSVDFKQVNLKEKVIATVPIMVVGESAGVKEGGVLEQSVRELKIEALPLDIPAHIEVDITELGLGHHLCVADIKCPANVTILDNAEEQVINIAIPRSVAVAEGAAESEAAAEEAPAAE
ncbi:MAG: 50S ribosomal protein L25 [bacterium]|nr:50S ribosomal protein L25 [bacterium]